MKDKFSHPPPQKGAQGRVYPIILPSYLFSAGGGGGAIILSDLGGRINTPSWREVDLIILLSYLWRKIIVYVKLFWNNYFRENYKKFR